MAAAAYAPLNALEGDPAHHAAAVTPDTNNDLSFVTTALFLNVAAAGTLIVNMVGGEGPVTFTFANAFTGILPIRVTRVLATGTATNIVALWR